MDRFPSLVEARREYDCDARGCRLGRFIELEEVHVCAPGDNKHTTYRYHMLCFTKSVWAERDRQTMKIWGNIDDLGGIMKYESIAKSTLAEQEAEYLSEMQEAGQ